MSFYRGQIVYALDDIPDQNGRNPKPNRPFIVISPNEYIAVSFDLEGIAISGNNWQADDTHIELPHSNHSFCHTGLTKRSIAVCSWKVVLRQDRIESKRGHVKPDLLSLILQGMQRASG